MWTQKKTTQWQDFHNILTACYEALLRSAVSDFLGLDEGEESDKFWAWLDKLTCVSGSSKIQILLLMVEIEKITRAILKRTCTLT